MSISAKSITNIYKLTERKICTRFDQDYPYEDKWISFLVPVNAKTEYDVYEYFAANCARLDDDNNESQGLTEEDALLGLFKRQIKRYKGLNLRTSVDDDCCPQEDINKNHREMWE